MTRSNTCRLLLGATIALVGANSALAVPITFSGPADYDNTKNTVTAGPTTNYNQTSGKFRDIFWWSINNGQPRVGSDDFINRGNSLILVNNSAVEGPGPYTSLNFTGPSISGGQNYLSIYDTTPADGPATKDLFDATLGVTVAADVLFVKHSSSGGVVALYNEGQDALALLAHNGDGNNPDHGRLDLIWQSPGGGQILSSQTLPFTTFDPQEWFRVSMEVSVVGDSYTMTGKIWAHSTPSNPNSALGTLLTTLNHSGSLSNPGNQLDLTNPGQVGVMAQGNEAIALPDNVGISITNFDAIMAPEPSTWVLLALGSLLLLARRRWR